MNTPQKQRAVIFSVLILAAIMLFSCPGQRIPALDSKADNYFSEAITKAGLAYAKESGLEIIELSPEERTKWYECYEPSKEAYIEAMKKRGLPGQEFLEEVIRLRDQYASQ